MSKLIRSIFVLLAATLTYSQVVAQTRSAAAMKEIADYHLYTDHAKLIMEDGDLRIFNSADRDGFIVLSANPELPEVLGFSDSGNFNPDSIPINMRFWMDCINQTSEAVTLGLISAEQAFATASATRADVSPLLGGIMWDQSEPYNLLCPMDYDKHSVTGCGATALAQMMMFYKYPAVGKGSITYDYKKSNGNTETINYDFTQTKFNWEKMRESYTAAYEKNYDTVGMSIGQIGFTGLEAYSSGSGVLCLIDTMFNNSTKDFSGDITWLLYDKDNKFLEASSDYYTISETLGSGYMWGSTKILPGRFVMPLSYAMPNVYADGTYRIYLGCRKTGTHEWSKCSSYKGQSTNYLEVKKSGTLFAIDGIVAECSYSEDEANAVAELMYACGAALETSYAYDGSSVSITAPFSGSVDYFGYDQDNFLATDKYLSTQRKNEIIIEELEAGRPVYLGGATKPNDKGEQAGHAFIADGVRYDINRTPWFHINWGWNGYMNGYFLITSLAPSGTGIGASDGDDYAHTLYIIGGFQPENNKYEGSAFAYNGLKCNTEKVEKSGSFGLYLYEIYNMSHNSVSGALKVFLKGENKEYECGTIYDFSKKAVDTYSGWKWDTEQYTTFNVPASVPDGNYEIVIRGESKTAPGVYGQYITAESPKLTVGNPTVIEQIKNEEPRRERLFDLFGRPASAKASGIVITESGKKTLIKD